MKIPVEIPFVETTKPIKENKVALIDADHIKYIVTYNMFKEMEMIGEELFYETKEELLIEKTLSMAYSFLEKIQDPIIFCFSGPSYNTFRAKICYEKGYKSSRKKKTDYYDYEGKKEDMYRIFEIISEKFNTLLFSDLEADDVVSMLHDKDSYIISKDKDLLQCAGLHYDFEKDEVYEITESEAIRNLFKQILIGDTTDSIPGLHRYGEKTFERDFQKITGFEDYLSKTQELFIEKHGNLKGLDIFCEMYSLVKMRMNRGDYFLLKYDHAFQMKNTLLNSLT